MRRRFNGCSTPLTFFFLCRWRDVCRTGDARPARRALRTYIFRTPMSGTCVCTLTSVEQVKKLSNVSLRHEFLMFSLAVAEKARGESTVKLHGSTQAKRRNHSSLSLFAANQILSPPTQLVLHSSNHSLGSLHL